MLGQHNLDQSFTHAAIQSSPTSATLLLFFREMHPAGRKLAAAVACLVYMTISSTLIVLNQQLMSEDGFRYPMALSGLGMGFSAVASYIACKVKPSSNILQCVLCSFPECLHACLRG